MTKYNPSIKFPDGIIAVYTTISGPQAKRTLKMAIDTGAAYTVIPVEKVIATGHEIPTLQEKRVKIFTASGIEYVPLVTVSSLSGLGVTVSNIHVVCHQLPSESPVEGLLGLNFLIHVPAFIEFYRNIQTGH